MLLFKFFFQVLACILLIVLVILCCICLCTGIWFCFKLFFNSKQSYTPVKEGNKVRSKRRRSADERENSVSVTRPRHSRFDRYRAGRRSSRRGVHSSSPYTSPSRYSSHSSHHRRSHEKGSRSSRLGHSSHRHRSSRDLRTRTEEARRKSGERKSLHTNSKRSRRSDELRLHSADGLGQRFSSSRDSQHHRSSHHKRDGYSATKVQPVKVNVLLNPTNNSFAKQQPKQFYSSQLPGNVQTQGPSVVITQDRLGISDLYAGSSSSSSEKSSSERAPLPPAQVNPHNRLPIVPGTTPQYVQQPSNQLYTSPQTERRDSEPENSESSSQKTPVHGTNFT